MSKQDIIWMIENLLDRPSTGYHWSDKERAERIYAVLKDSGVLCGERH